MKKLAIILFLLFTLTSIKAQKADTIAVDNNKIEELIEFQTSKNKNVYYIKYEGYLIPTNKTVFDAIHICSKYNAKCALILITRKGKKRITLN